MAKRNVNFGNLFVGLDPEITEQITQLKEQLTLVINNMATKEQLDAVKSELTAKLDLIEVKIEEETTQAATETRSLKESLEAKIAELTAKLDVPVDFSAELKIL